MGIDGGPSRFGEGYHLLRVGIVARSVDGERAQAGQPGVRDRRLRLDGSREPPGLVKRSLRLLVDELGEGDRVGIVVYGRPRRACPWSTPRTGLRSSR
jgi:Ca-activated chloride channel homolog